jgi:hypothetical protein
MKSRGKNKRKPDRLLRTGAERSSPLRGSPWIPSQRPTQIVLLWAGGYHPDIPSTHYDPTLEGLHGR